MREQASARAVDGSLVEKVRRYIQDGGFAHTQRLSPERRLCEILGLSRSALRKALAEIESDGLIWRHVGRGTFVGARPVHNLDDIAFLGGLADPVQVLYAGGDRAGTRASGGGEREPDGPRGDPRL